MEEPQESFFQPVRAAAEALDALPDPYDATQPPDETSQPIDSIESLCLECGKNGITRLLLTSIPFFREVIIASFRCDHCGNQNNQVQSAGEIQPFGSIHKVKVTSSKDLDRSLIKSEFCSISIPEVELSIPPGRGQLTTVEGIISNTISDLSLQQPVRQYQDPPLYEKVEQLLQRLRHMIGQSVDQEDQQGQRDDRSFEAFTVILEDPSGNSCIEAFGGLNDANWSKSEYKRSSEQDVVIGLQPPEYSSGDQQVSPQVQTAKTLTDDYQEEQDDSIYSFPSTCSRCHGSLETLMKKIDIPHFKEVMVMATKCDQCGYRDNEIKTGGAISTHGRKLVLKVEDTEDLGRDILKSETAGLCIPELDLVLEPGTLGGRFTTVEGLLIEIHQQLKERVFARGDTSIMGTDDKMAEFLRNLEKATTVDMKYTLILDDPLANSYIQNLNAPDPDPNLSSEDYERSFAQQEDLGLNDIKTENYEQADDQ